MRIFIFFTFFLISFSVSPTDELPKLRSGKHTCPNALGSGLPDIICKSIENNPFILFTYGHYGYSWSIVARIDNRYQAFSGRVEYCGDKYLSSSKPVNEFDTTSFFIANGPIFEWAFDSIAYLAKDMKAIPPKTFVTVYEDLSVFNSNGELTFSSLDTQTYAGPDSINFNGSFHRLSLLMRWLADPEIRKYLPDILPKPPILSSYENNIINNEL